MLCATHCLLSWRTVKKRYRRASTTWLWLDKRINNIASEIEIISKREDNCQRLMSVPGIGPMISTAMVAAIRTGEAFERGRDFGAWLGLVPRQYSTGGKAILGRISTSSKFPLAKSSRSIHSGQQLPNRSKYCMSVLGAKPDILAVN